jgi:phosphatidate phosphatase LPIN
MNSATFSGCIDIIAIKQPNGELKATSFHVRYG